MHVPQHINVRLVIPACVRTGATLLELAGSMAASAGLPDVLARGRESMTFGTHSVLVRLGLADFPDFILGCGGLFHGVGFANKFLVVFPVISQDGSTYVGCYDEAC